MYGEPDFRLPKSVLATVAQKSFNGKFPAKIDFPIGHFMLPLLMLTLEVKSLSILIFDKYLDHILVKFEQNRMVRTGSVASPFCQEGQSERIFPIFAFSSRFFLFFPDFSSFFLIFPLFPRFSPDFSRFLANFSLSGVALCPPCHYTGYFVLIDKKLVNNFRQSVEGRFCD